MFESFLQGFIGKAMVIIGLLVLIPLGLIFLFFGDIPPRFHLAFLLAILGVCIGGYMSYLSSQTVRIGDSMVGSEKAEFTHDKEWNVKAKYDDDIKAALVQLTPLGEAACKRFREIYGVINDKAKIPAIVDAACFVAVRWRQTGKALAQFYHTRPVVFRHYPIGFRSMGGPANY
jgi:hypothetical protein